MPKDAEPRITFDVFMCRCEDPCRFCGDGGSERIGNELINFLFVIVAVCRNSLLFRMALSWPLRMAHFSASITRTYAQRHSCSNALEDEAA
jgi:hypothetical protein